MKRLKYRKIGNNLWKKNIEHDKEIFEVVCRININEKEECEVIVKNHKKKFYNFDHMLYFIDEDL